MYRTFNMGIGMVTVVGNEDTEGCMELARSSGESPYLIGKIVEGERGVEITE
jgi:phosphoribosylformylglycinamidine cyclo-ligase